MRIATVWMLVLAAAAPVATGQADRAAAGQNLLTRFLDWADIHPPARTGRLTFFPITLSRPVERLDGVLTMAEAMKRGLLVIEELDRPEVARARFVNKSADRMIFLMAGELITGGRQNRTLQSDALLAANSSAELPLYCVQKGRWQGAGKFDGAPTVAPQAVRERAAARASQDEIWSEVDRANRRLGADSATEDLHAAMAKPENVRQLAGWRERVTPHLPRGCVGVVVAAGGRIVGADLFNSPELFADLREKVLDAYLSQYGWPLPVRRESRVVPVGDVTAEQVRGYLRGCYDSRLVEGELRGVGRVHYLRGVRSGQTLGYEGRGMVHTVLTGPQVVPVRPLPRR
ncbi:MAG TPA: DUF6569 family protein [Phycisphaerae bacterium]|nr:DUF6569 family protein [Phycisphaerae bacterium]